MTSFLASGWYGGSKSSPTYGLKISIADREKYFGNTWKQIDLLLPERANPVLVNIDKASFWSGTCHELVAKEIGVWLVGAGKAPWPRRQPPKVRITSLGDASFRGELAI